MQTVLIVFHLMIVVALVGTVLLQRSEGGALGVGGSGGFMTGRGQANALTRATAILATLFFITSLALSIIASYSRAPKSILDGANVQHTTTSPTGSPLDQMRQIEQQRSGQAPASQAPDNQAPASQAPAGQAPAGQSPAPAPTAPASGSTPAAPSTAPAAPEPPRSQ